jgi:hypothetical protein
MQERRVVTAEEWYTLSEVERLDVWGPWDYCLACGQTCKPDDVGSCDDCVRCNRDEEDGE